MDKRPDESDAIIQSLKKQLAQEQERSRALDAQLNAIQGTRGWRLLNKAYAIRYRLLPAGSRRERLYQGLFGRRAGPKDPRRVQPAAVAPVRPASLRTEPILVYQMGKVGSTAVQKALIQAYRSLGLEVPVLHAHFIHDLDERERKLVLRAKSGYLTVSAFNHLRRSREVQEQLAARQGECWNVVTLVRDPLARNMSRFFHNLPMAIPDWKSLYEAGHLTAEEVQAMFIADAEHHQGPAVWFENELKRTFGFDVYKTPFPCSEGYRVYPPAPNGRLLLIRLEDLDRVAGRAMHEFLGLEGFHIERLNTADEGEYSELYQQVKRLRLPEQFVTEMYATQYARHFYSDAEIAAFKQRWGAS